MAGVKETVASGHVLIVASGFAAATTAVNKAVADNSEIIFGVVDLC